MLNPLVVVNWPNGVRNQKIYRRQEELNIGSQELVGPKHSVFMVQYLARHGYMCMTYLALTQSNREINI